MTTEEVAIVDYLKLFPDVFVSPTQICKRAAGRKRFLADENWAKIHLRRMEDDGKLVSDASGHYKVIVSKKAKRSQHCFETITTYVMELDETADNTPFSTLLRDAIQIAYQDPAPIDSVDKGQMPA